MAESLNGEKLASHLVPRGTSLACDLLAESLSSQKFGADPLPTAALHAAALRGGKALATLHRHALASHLEHLRRFELFLQAMEISFESSRLPEVHYCAGATQPTPTFTPHPAQPSPASANFSPSGLEQPQHGFSHMRFAPPPGLDPPVPYLQPDPPRRRRGGLGGGAARCAAAQQPAAHNRAEKAPIGAGAGAGQTLDRLPHDPPRAVRRSWPAGAGPPALTSFHVTARDWRKVSAPAKAQAPEAQPCMAVSDPNERAPALPDSSQPVQVQPCMPARGAIKEEAARSPSYQSTQVQPSVPAPDMSKDAGVLPPLCQSAQEPSLPGNAHIPRRKRGSRRGRRCCCSFVLTPSPQLLGKWGFVPRLIGRGGTNVQKIARTCNAKVRVRGKGSGYLEGPRQEEAALPLQVALSCEGQADFEQARCMVINLLDATVRQLATECSDQKDLPQSCFYYILDQNDPSQKDASPPSHL